MVFPKGTFVLLILSLLVGVYACEDQPRLHYPKKVLVPVLADIHIARSAVQNAPSLQRDSMYELLFDQLCTVHGVEGDKISKDLDYLMAHPDRAASLYEDVIQFLESHQDSLKGKY